LQVLGVEGVGVDDQDPARLEIAQVGPERGRVHGDQGVELVAGGVNVVAGKVDLEPRHAGERAGRGADLGREVREGADVVAENGRGVGELGPGKLHAVAGVAGEADGNGVKFLNGRAGAAGAGTGRLGPGR
jgi:hypothetical protein